ncbi:hypothetical protein [Helicobacter sp. 13S00477-4]|uniref:hypothetical protein n=1 Tax=Helicobacter sp. 13S00477-4 TaxID=1905759 RepID=UPI000BA7B1A2|nr:hypothetical protein [Helicobacter sp. 13S00477-4]PAF50322.1 hypothetical protein BKH44_08490 [Helicobacter sp. 13S00477-4]
MKKKLDKDYVDKLSDSRVGKERIENWSDKEKYVINRVKIQIDFYCKEFLAKFAERKENQIVGEDRFLLFDHVAEEVVKPQDFKPLLTRYSTFIPQFVDIYNKYEVAMWGSGSSNVGGNG